MRIVNKPGNTIRNLSCKLVVYDAQTKVLRSRTLIRKRIVNKPVNTISYLSGRLVVYDAQTKVLRIRTLNQEENC